MNGEYVLVSKKIELEATGGADTVSIPVPFGMPVRHLTAWVHTGKPGVLNVVAQPKLLGGNDGSSTNITAAGIVKIFQAAADEIRPPSSLIPQYTSAEVCIPTWEIELVNNAAAALTLHLYVCAAGSVGKS